MSANDSASCTDVIKGRGKELPKKEVERIAQDELRETKNVRETALQQFREWVAKNKDISSVRTGKLTRIHHRKIRFQDKSFKLAARDNGHGKNIGEKQEIRLKITNTNPKRFGPK